jgi:hypothetical protein
MTGGPLRRLQELAAPDQVEERARSRATKEANLADRLSECNQNSHYDGRPASPTAGARGPGPSGGTRAFASDEGGEFGGPPVRVQSELAL